jgi:hypothetical protein
VTVGQLLDRYALEVIRTKAVTTQAQNQIAVNRLRVTFGAWPLMAIEPHHIYTYADVSTKEVKQPDSSTKRVKARTAPLRELEVLSHAPTPRRYSGAI